MDNRKCFLDTCIFLARAYGSEIETWSCHCDRLFCGDFSLHTSVTVEYELSRVENRRRRYYRDLISYTSGGGSIDSFDLSGMSENDSEHFVKLVKKLRNLKKAEVLAEARLFIERVRSSLEDSIQRLQHPIAPRYGNAYIEDLVAARLGNPLDSRIVCDFIGWAITEKEALLLTLDGGHILDNKSDILQFVKDYLHIDSPGFDFLHVKDFFAK